MREVMKFSKNYVTDEIITKNVTKNSDSLIGRATIKVMDSEGNLKQEVLTENIIHQNIRDWEWYRIAYQNIVSGNIVSGAYSLATPFKRLMLCTDEEEDTESKKSLKGDLVGVAIVDDDAAGTHPYKGSYDKVNSFTTITEDGFLHNHRVFEFGNAKANGTFSSLAFTYGTFASDYNNSINTTTFSKKLPPFRTSRVQMLGNANLNTPSGLFYKDIKGDLYKYTDSKYYKVINIHQFLNGVENAKLELDHNPNYIDHTLSTSQKHYPVITNVVTRNHKHAEGIETSFDILVYNEDKVEYDRISFSNIKQLIPDFYKYVEAYTSSPSYYGVTVGVSRGLVTSEGNVYLNFSLNSGTSSAPIFQSYDATTKTISGKADASSINAMGIYNIYSKKWIKPPLVDDVICRQLAYETPITSSTNNITSKFIYEDVEYFGLSSASSATQNILFSLDVNGCRENVCLGEIIAGSSSFNSNSSYNYYGFGPMIDEYPGYFLNAYISISENSSFGISRIIPHCTYSKLPAPVTKTEDDTMKIEYDYFIQIPMQFNPDGDHTQMPK